MRYTLTTIILAALVLLLPACDELIGDVEDPIDSAVSPELSSADQVPFLVTGVQTRFANVHDNVTILASLLSDQFIFAGERGGGATFPTYRDIDRAEITLDNNSVDAPQNYLGEYRYLADDLIERIAEIDELDPEEGGFTEEDMEMRANALMEAHFHGGLARYFWATYWGIDGATGGGVISDVEEPADDTRGEFIPSDQMFAMALERLDEARARAEELGNDYRVRVINSIVARVHLYQGDTETAQQWAEEGMEPGDEPFQSLHSERTGAHANDWFNASGPGRVQTAAALRFIEGEDYLAGNPEGPESVRIPLDFDAETTYALTGEEIEAWAQGRYMTRGAPIDFISWQENHLMLAELAIRNDDDAGTAEQLVNEVRASHGLDPVEGVDLDTVFLERDKELFTEGQRLPDQRRVTLEGIEVDEETHGWHRTVPTEGSMEVWWYLPITLDERDDNPNIP